MRDSRYRICGRRIVIDKQCAIVRGLKFAAKGKMMPAIKVTNQKEFDEALKVKTASDWIELHGNGEVTAHGSSQVRAHGSSQVIACGSSQVIACGSSRVRAHGSS